jgi:hypothetical protein
VRDALGQPGPASRSKQLTPLQPGAATEPHIHALLWHAAMPLGSCPQHELVSLPKQAGGLPVQPAASLASLDASFELASAPGPASQRAHAMPRGKHAQAPFVHVSAAYMLPQHPLQMSGAGPVQAEASLLASPIIPASH